MERAAFREELARWAEDETVHSSRVAVCRTVTEALRQAGQSLYVGGWVLRNQAMESLGAVTEMGAELASGAVQLFDVELWYAGAALVRQLIEVEYLTWRFSEDPSVASSWLASSPAEIRQRFAPKAMRQESAGRFRDKEYWTHCGHGGHPSPQGRLLLKNHSNPIGSQRWAWADLAQHLERLWGHLESALQTAGAEDIVAAKGGETAANAIAAWHEKDPLAARLPIDISE
jgi:hypothetical protein